MPPQDPADTGHPEATGPTPSPQAGPAEDIRTRMRRGLLQAMKARDQQAVAALRSTLAAIDNAEAVSVTPGTGTGGAGQASPAGGEGSPIAGAVVGLGAAEVERRTLTVQETEAIVRAEVTDREAAARDYERAGRPDHAEILRAQAMVLASYLDPPAGTP